VELPRSSGRRPIVREWFATAPGSHGLERSGGQRLRFWVFGLFVGLCFAGGGGARDDILSLLYVRPGAVLCAALILLLPGPVDLKAVRVPLALCAAFALVMALQLIPLPPDLWTSLPGRQLLAEAANVAGIPQPWRPLSIAPDLTLNSLAAMVVPIAALLGFAALDRFQRYDLLPILIAAALVSAFLAMLQLGGGEGSPFRLYRITNRDSGVGLFANRNHQAALLAITFPMLAVWAASGWGGKRPLGVRAVLAAALGIFLIPMILVTGSRAGLAFGALAALLGWLLYIQQARPTRRSLATWKTASIGVGGTVMVAILFAFAAPERAASLQRLLDSGLEGDVRIERFDLLAQLAGAMLPYGSGFGTFDPLYRIHEPVEALSPFYLNHAHNDLLELAITGGLPALALLLAGLVWVAARSVKNFRRWRAADTETAFARLATLIIGLLLVWSLVDYPLRTPILAMVFAIASGWLGTSRGSWAGESTKRSAGETA